MEIKPRLDIRPDELVLDIGSGNRPHPSASVLADRFLEESTQRAEGQALVADRPTVLADIEALPFRDGAFDYVIASHVLEHTQDPVRASSELSRVARRGYIETPSEIWELLYGADYHTHAVSLATDGTIVFKRKSRNSPIKDLIVALGHAEPFLVDLVDNHPELFYVSVEWEGSVRCRMSDDMWPDVLETESFIERLRPGRTTGLQAARALARSILPASARRALRDHGARFPLNRITRSAPDRGWPASAKSARKVDLPSIVACPVCRHYPLAWGDSTVVCTACNKRFDRTETGLPVLISEAVPSSGA